MYFFVFPKIGSTLSCGFVVIVVIIVVTGGGGYTGIGTIVFGDQLF